MADTTVAPPAWPELPDLTVSGSLANGVDTITLPISGYQGCAVSVQGSWSGTLVVQVSADGANFNHSTLWLVSGTSGTPGRSQTSISTNGNYIVLDLAGMSHARITFSTYTSGTATVTMRASAAAPAGTSPLATTANQGYGQRLACLGIKDAAGNAQPWQTASKAKFRDLAATVQSVKSSAGILKGLLVVNNQAAVAFVQVFDLATGSVTLGTTNPDLEFSIPANTTQYFALSPDGVGFATAISIASTTTEKGSTGSAAGVQVFALYV